MAVVVFCLIWTLWPLIAFDGGLALSPIVGLACLPFAISSAARFQPRWYMAPLAAFFAFAMLSALWSPRNFVIFDIQLAKGQFNLRSEGLRMASLFAALAVLITAARRMTDEGKRRVARFALVALIVQLLICFAIAVAEPQELQLFARLMSDSGEGVQNNSRNTLIMAAAAPSLLFGLTDGRRWFAAILIGAGVILLESWIIVARDVEAGVAALLAAAACIAAVRMFPAIGFRLIGLGLAGWIMTAPFVLGFITRHADATTATTSQGWRLAIWRRAIEIIVAHPVRGGGLGILRTIRETIPGGVFKDQLIIPNHPHNMFLELWAETGAIGAALLSAAIVLAAWRMPRPSELGPQAPRAAGLIGGMTAIALVSFDLWNEWWWAVGGMLAILAAIASEPRARLAPHHIPSL